ncbi:MAG: DUF2007 domain-containing protein [Flavobacteriales bacterium]|nr:DUF2007 domain-containing protein [Flavobacteriales bacterium]
MQNPTLLKKYFTSIEAHNAKNMLETNGIEAFVLGETATITYNFFTPTDGGIRLMVDEVDMELAQKLLKL